MHLRFLSILTLFLCLNYVGQGPLAVYGETWTNPTEIVSENDDRIALSPAEEEWLAAHPQINIAGPRSFPPFYFLNGNDELQGISADYIKRISKRLGIAINVIKNLPWQEVLDKAQAGEIDLIACLAKIKERESYLHYSSPYLSFPLVIISKKDASFIGGIEDLHNKKLALIKKNVTVGWLKNDGIDFIFHEVQTPLKGLEAVSYGNADASIENLATASYLIQKQGLTNLKVAAPTPYGNYNLYMAVPKNMEILGSIIDKTIASISPKQATDIRNKWLTVRYEHGLRVQDIVKWVMLTLLISGVLILVMIIWNNKLQVEMKQRILATSALKESEERLRTLINTMPDLVCFKDGQGNWLESNNINIKLFQLDHVDYRGKTSETLAQHTPFFKELLIKNAQKDEMAWVSGKGVRGDERITLPDGTSRLFDVIRTVTFHSDGRRKGLVWVGRDITDKSKMEQRLQQSQKFEAIGTLAGGIAHDFNNLLMAIQGRASLIQMDIDPSHEHAGHLRAVSSYVRSATDLTGQLLGLARSGKYEVVPTDINTLLQESIDMFGRTRKELAIHTRFAPTAPVAEVDINQIKQALLNLYINAWQAMPEGGELYLESRETDLNEKFCKPHQITHGKYVKISITDTGVGMEKKVQQQIFDPFFTTKEKGRGTGLGLASAYGIIRNHAGVITVYSEAGEGTTFNIYLPRSGKVAKDETVVMSQPIKGNETILLVDDEEMILEVGEEMLKKLDYQVLVANGGIEGIQMFKAHHKKIDLVILDLIMSDLGGEAVFEMIREIRPDAVIMLASGYSVNGQAAALMDKGCNEFIQKPFDLIELSKKIRHLLDNIAKPQK